MKKLIYAAFVALGLVACGGGGGAGELASLSAVSADALAAKVKPAPAPDPTLVAQPVVRVNTSTDGQQTLRAIGAEADGGYSVGFLSVFSTPPDASGTFTTFDRPFVQRYDSAGAAVGSNNIIDGNDRAMAVLTDGRVVTVCCENQLGPQVTIFITWLNPDGSFLDLRNVITRSQVTNISTNPFFTQMKVTALSDGGFVVSWLDVQPIGSTITQTLYTQRYDGLNREVGGPMAVATTLESFVISYRIYADAEGGYTVDMTDAFSSVFHFDANQARLDIFSTTLGRPVFLLPLEGDRYVLFTQDSTGTVRQFYDGAGHPVGDRVATSAMFDAKELVDGSFVVFFRDGTAQRYDGTGAPIGNVLLLDTAGAVPQVAALASGSFAIAWTATGAGGDLDVFTRSFIEVLTPTQAAERAKRKACLNSAKGMTGQERKAFVDACLAA